MEIGIGNNDAFWMLLAMGNLLQKEIVISFEHWRKFNYLRHTRFWIRTNANKDKTKRPHRTKISALVGCRILSLAESRKVLNLPPVTIFPYQNAPPVFEVLVVDRAWLGRGSHYKLRENIFVYYSYGFESMVIVAVNKPVLEYWKWMMEFDENYCTVWPIYDQWIWN